MTVAIIDDKICYDSISNQKRVSFCCFEVRQSSVYRCVLSQPKGNKQWKPLQVGLNEF